LRAFCKLLFCYFSSLIFLFSWRILSKSMFNSLNFSFISSFSKLVLLRAFCKLLFCYFRSLIFLFSWRILSKFVFSSLYFSFNSLYISFSICVCVHVVLALLYLSFNLIYSSPSWSRLHCSINWCLKLFIVSGLNSFKISCIKLFSFWFDYCFINYFWIFSSFIALSKKIFFIFCINSSQLKDRSLSLTFF